LITKKRFAHSEPLQALIASSEDSVILNDMNLISFFKLWVVFAVLAVLLTPFKLIAQPSPVHADLPLWTNSEDLWPRSFSDDDGFGCSGPVKFGEWKRTYYPQTEEGDAYTTDPDWLKIHNYGVFHCAYGFRWSYDLEGLETETAKLGHMVELGFVDTENGKRKLWAMQIGFSPGSDYIFLTRLESSEPDTPFDVLDMKCPKKYIRKTENIDIFLTDYCSINDKRSMRRFAKRMAKRPPTGKLEYIERPDK